MGWLRKGHKIALFRSPTFKSTYFIWSWSSASLWHQLFFQMCHPLTVPIRLRKHFSEMGLWCWTATCPVGTGTLIPSRALWPRTGKSRCGQQIDGNESGIRPTYQPFPLLQIMLKQSHWGGLHALTTEMSTELLETNLINKLSLFSTKLQTFRTNESLNRRVHRPEVSFAVFIQKLKPLMETEEMGCRDWNTDGRWLVTDVSAVPLLKQHQSGSQ